MKSKLRHWYKILVLLSLLAAPEKSKLLVSSQARNNSEPYDQEKSVTENWDSNPIIADALGSSISGLVELHKETCDGLYCMPGLMIY